MSMFQIMQTYCLSSLIVYCLCGIDQRMFLNMCSSCVVFLQTEISFSARVEALGRYVFVVHYCQPEHTTFPVEVRVEAGRTWTGEFGAQCRCIKRLTQIDMVG